MIFTLAELVYILQPFKSTSSIILTPIFPDNAVKNLLDFLMKFKKVFKHSTWLSFNGSRYDTQLIL